MPVHNLEWILIVTWVKKSIYQELCDTCSLNGNYTKFQPLLPTHPQRVNVQQWAKVQHQLEEPPDQSTPERRQPAPSEMNGVQRVCHQKTHNHKTKDAWISSWLHFINCGDESSGNSLGKCKLRLNWLTVDNS